jgi:glycosyltransferase involved in cell wall biosynthesis
LIDRNPQACADALDTLLKDDTMRARMGRAGRQQVEANWTWDRSADQLEQIFEQIVKRHQR